MIIVAISAIATGLTAKADDRPNIVLIVCDNLGYGDVEPFGSTVHRTPHLNRMAAEGRKFTHFYVSAGVCTPSRASFLTGCYPQQLGLHLTPRDGQVLRPVSPYGLHPDEYTLAEMLRDAGYATGIFGKWHLGDQTEFLPTNQGFDEFLGIPYSDDMTAEIGRRLGDRFDGHLWPPLPLMKGTHVIEAPVDRNQLTKRLTESAIDFIERNHDHPFFVYFPQAMPGSTRQPFASAEFRGSSDNGPWGDSIEELDWSTGRILDTLETFHLKKKTLVIWTSDNGAPLATDASSVTRGSNQPLHGRGYTTSEGAFRVPTIMWWPETIPADTTCEDLLTSMDLMPTIAAIGGGELPDDRPVDGKDVTPLILGELNAATPHEAFYYYHQDQLQAVRSGPWKLFVPLESFTRHPHFARGASDAPLLFHLYDDRSCRANVAAQHPDIVDRLTRLAEAAREQLGDLGRDGNAARPVGYVENPMSRRKR